MDSVIGAVQKLKVVVAGGAGAEQATSGNSSSIDTDTNMDTNTDTNMDTNTDTNTDTFKTPVCATSDPPFHCATDEANAATSNDTKPPLDLLVCGTNMTYETSGSGAESGCVKAESEPGAESDPPAEVTISESTGSTPSPSQLCHTEILEITFTVLHDEDSDDEDAEPSPYIELGGSFKKTYDLCQDKEEIVLTNEQIVMRDDEPQEDSKYVTLILDYPLDDDYEFKIYPDDKRGFTRGHLIREVKRHYDKVYAEEEETSTVPVDNIPGMQNRVTTDGNYGVWGHDIGDLALHTVNYNRMRNLFWLGVDS